MSWQKVDEELALASSGAYLKLENDDDSVEVVFCGDPWTKKVVWEGGKTRDPVGDEKYSLRIFINVFDVSAGVMKVWEYGPAVHKTLKKQHNKYGLYARTWTITRNGSKGDTRTVYIVTPGDEVSEELAARAAKFELAGPEPTDDIPI